MLLSRLLNCVECRPHRSSKWTLEEKLGDANDGMGVIKEDGVDDTEDIYWHSSRQRSRGDV